MGDVSPRVVLRQVVLAVPPRFRKNMVIVGSLAAGFQLLPDTPTNPVRTKDADCVLFPRIKAVTSGRAIAEKLISLGWEPRTEGDHGRPGDASTPDNQLPVVSLYPPKAREWYLELLAVPGPESRSSRSWTRLELSIGHFGLPTYRFLGIAAWKPLTTDLGVLCGRPELLALANLLEHPFIGPDRMSGLIADRAIKRSNKDLGRVLAIAHLAGGDVVETWVTGWADALRRCFPEHWRKLAVKAGSGLRELIDSREDLEEARVSCNNGLLASRPVVSRQLEAVARRLIQDAVEPLEKLAGR